MTGHSAHDDASYVSSEVFDEWKRKDPISRYQRVLLQEEIISQEKIDAMQRQVIEEIDQAVDWAESSPYPEPEDCLRGVYYEE